MAPLSLLAIRILLICIICIALLLCDATSAAAQRFTTATRFCVGGQGSSVDVGDLDDDGDLDIVFGMGRHTPEPNLIYLNRGKGV